MRITSDPGNGGYTFELETRLFGTRRYLVRREYGQGHRRCWEVLKDDLEPGKHQWVRVIDCMSSMGSAIAAAERDAAD